MAGPAIQPLSPGVRSYLRTGVALCSVAQCMEELVLNSIDAGATCIAVRIDLSCFKIQVVDNGTGITQSQLELVGQRYHTSKCHTMDDLNQLCHYGYRGEALASLRDASSVLEITSRTKNLTQTFCKIFNKGTSMKVMPSSVRRPSTGTTVTAHDLFYNMPVRKKAMNPVLEFERVRKRLEGIALMRPAISFSLRNDITGNVVLQTHKTNGVLNVFTSLFGIGRSKTLSAVQGQSGCFSVEGYIGKEGFSKKDLQFVYINKRLVLKTKIHKVINFLLGKSLILRKKGVSDRQGESKQQESVMSVTSSPTKYSEKFGVFVVNVSCPYTEYDVTFDPAKTLVEFKDWNTLCTCIEGTVSDFLKRECLLLGIQDMMLEEKATSSEDNKPDDQTSGDSTKPLIEQISTSNNRNFLTSKLVKRQTKPACDQAELDEDENVIATNQGLVSPEDQENVIDIDSSEKNKDKSNQNTNSDKNGERTAEEAAGSTLEHLETVSSSNDTTEHVTDCSLLSSTDSTGQVNYRKKHHRSDSDDKDDDDNDDVQSKFDEDEDYESEDPIPKVDLNFTGKGKNSTNTVQRQCPIIRLETPHLGCNGGSTLSLIRKSHGSSSGTVRGKRLEKISCFESLKQRLDGDKASVTELQKSGHQNQSSVRQYNQIINSSKSSELSRNLEATKTREDFSGTKVTEQTNYDSLRKNGADEIMQKGTSSQEGHLFSHSQPQKRNSGFEDCSVAAKLARLSRSRQQESNDDSDKVLRVVMEKECSVSASGDGRSETSCIGGPSSSKCHHKMVTSNEKKLENEYNAFESSFSLLLPDQVPNRLIGRDSNINDSSNTTRKMMDTSNAPKKFLTTASLVQTYDDVFLNNKPPKSLTLLDTSNPDEFRCDTFKIGCYPERGTLEHKHKCNQGFEPVKTNPTVDHNQIMSDKMTTFLDCTEDMRDAGLHTEGISFNINDRRTHMPTVSSESEADSIQDVMFEGTPKSINKLDIEQGIVDDNFEDSNTDLLCYEEFDYAVMPIRKESDHRRTEQSYQIFDNSLTCHQKQTVPNPVLPQDYKCHDTRSTVQDEGHKFTINTYLSQGDAEGYSELTTQNSQGFVPSMSSLEPCSSNKSPVTQGPDTPKSQGFVPISELSAVMDKQVIMETIQESQGFVPVPAFTEKRAISPAVSEGFSPVMMDDDVNMNLNTDNSSPRGNRHLCDDSNTDGTVTSTNQGMETLAEYLDSYSSSIAELYEEDMSYVKKKSKSCIRLPQNMITTVASSEQSRSAVQNDSLSSDLSIRSQSWSYLSEGSVQSQLSNDLFKTQVRFRPDLDCRMSQTSVHLSTLGTDQCQLNDRDKGADCAEDGEKGSSSEQNHTQKATDMEGSHVDEMSCGLIENKLTCKRNMDSLTCNESMAYFENLDRGPQSALDHTSISNTSVNHISLSPQEDRHVQCESNTVRDNCGSAPTVDITDNPYKAALDGGETTVINSITNRMCNKLDPDSCNARLQDINQRISCSSDNVSDIGNQSNKVSENTNSKHKDCPSSSIRSEEYVIQGLSPKQLKVLRESNRKGKLPMNILNICDKSQVKRTDVSAEPDRSANTVTHQWSDDDDDDLVAVVESGQIQSQQSQSDSTADSHCNQPWMEVEHPKTGEILYVNCLTGHTRPQDGSWKPPPPDKTTNSPNLTLPSTKKAVLGDLSPQSHNTLLHIMSDHLETLEKEEEDLLSVKWTGARYGCMGREDSQTTETVNTRCVEDLLEDWDNPVFKRPEQSVVTAVEVSGRSRGSARVNSVLHAHKFTKDMLQDIQVVGQVDNKFIACMTGSRTNSMATDPNLMLLFDQHAVHERVRLERLTKEAYEGDNRIRRSIVTPTKLLTLMEDEVRVMMSYKDEFSRIGIDFKEDDQSRDSIYVHSIPACIMLKEANEVKRKRDSIAWNVVLNLLKEHVELLISTSGVLGRLPATIHKVLCSQACHGAVKFGDQLSLEECDDLLSSLAKCDLPFQCAHGRPSIMPLLEMDKLKPEQATVKPNLWKISKHLQKI